MRTSGSGDSSTARVTSIALLSLGALHVAWALGSTFPFRTRSALNDAVIGRQATPGAAECGVVAVLVGVAAGSVARAERTGGPLPRMMAAGVALVLATRAAFGFAGRTSMIVPGSDSPRFTRLDRRVYAPLCAALAVGAACAASSRHLSRPVGGSSR